MTLTNTELCQRAEAALRESRHSPIRQGMAVFTRIHDIRATMYGFLGIDLDSFSFAPIPVAAFSLEIKDKTCIALSNTKLGRVFAVSQAGWTEILEFCERAGIEIDWEHDAADVSKLVFAAGAQELHVCWGCLGLVGSLTRTNRRWPAGLTGPVAQDTCQCPDRLRMTASHGLREALHLDINEVLRICMCCGADVVPSGSKWSPFFCRPCMHLAQDLNRRAGHLVIPIGRHSMMNGIGLSNDSFDQVSVRRFLHLAGSMQEAINRICGLQFKVAARARSIASAGHHQGEAPATDTMPSVTVSRYLEMVGQGISRGYTSPGIAREALFEALLADMGG